MKNSIDECIKKSVALFEEGYNCSQAVFMTYADRYGIDANTAAKLSCSFGGGMGRLREVCGAVSAMSMVMGLEYPYTNPADKVSKNRNYTKVQAAATAFKEHFGSYICADLLQKKREAESPVSDHRNEAYYASRPCTRCVAKASEIVALELFGTDQE